MKKITVNVYRFSELSDNAKQRAKDDYAANFGYSWAEEAIESIKALAKHFGGRMKDWSVDFFAGSHSDAKFDMPEISEADIRRLLAALGGYDEKTLKGYGDCKLTGYCSDEDAIDGFRYAYAKGERDLNALMQAAFDTWLAAAQSDARAQYEDENFSEQADANDYWYTEYGELTR